MIVSATVHSPIPTRVFPLAFSNDRRYLCSQNGTPFLVHGDSPYSLEVQCTRAQIDAYLDARLSQGFSAILFQTFEHKYSSQTPAYTNAADGANPFTSQPASTDFSTPNNTYWNTIDYIVAGAARRGIACFITPAYLGFTGGDQGWDAELTADTAAHLQSYGAFLANRYGASGNIVWVMGGDYAGTTTERDKQWNIVTGMRSVRTDQIISAHPARSEDAYALWGPGGQNYVGWNLGSTYCQKDGSDSYSLAATAYGRGMPFVLLEGGYEGEGGDWRKCAYGTLLSGGCGHFFGNNPVWGFGEPIASGGSGAASVIANNLSTPGAQQMTYLAGLMRSYAWQKLVPRTDASLVSSSLGSLTTRLYPALSSDGTFALIYVPSAQTVTVVMTVFTKTMRIRLMDVLTGTFTLVGLFANTGTQSVVTTAEQVIVAD
jgi:hypothetical protein